MTTQPSTAEWLTKGGDRRIVCDPVHGVNKYGCPPKPEPDVLAYGSVTASTISTAGFAAAEQLREQLPHTTYASELQRIRRELIHLCELGEVSGLDIIFAASGTDLHLFAAQLTAHPLVIMIEQSETGSGVPAALAGKHFSDCTAFGKTVTPNNMIQGSDVIEIAAVPSRTEDGNPRSAASIDAEVEALAANAIAAGRRVLLIITDVSKTGLIAPSPACALNLQRRFPSKVETMIDGCQFRLAPSTLRAYLEQGFSVAITGSKFLTGPAFSGALLVPQAVAERWRGRALPTALAAYSARADWPENWAASSALPDVANVGLLLRWEAALVELRAFHALPETAVTAFVKNFAAAIYARLADDSVFELLATPAPDRHQLTTAKTWDCWPTIFPFLLHSPNGASVNRENMQRIYEALRMEHCQLGQPVLCGMRDNVPVSALRLCLSARLIVDAVQERGSKAIITEALGVLDKVAQLTRVS